ncbi:MAG: hypothetical protein FJW96_10220 [Actinobacteria bacterium]|nr:hypothetical protein [Actinomycetota bacterium]
MPVRAYLDAQGRFAHLADEEKDAIQAHVDARWEALTADAARSRETAAVDSAARGHEPGGDGYD